eukprot:COSAG02_NODE_27075_length_617_cov_1.154440_1_plen_50_part_10
MAKYANGDVYKVRCGADRPCGQLDGLPAPALAARTGLLAISCSHGTSPIR